MKGILRFLGDFEAKFAYLLLVCLVLLLCVQIVDRYLFHHTFVWLEEISRISFIWLIYFSVAVAAKEGRHIRVGIVDLFLPAFVLKLINYIADSLWVSFNLVLIFLGILLVKSTFQFEYRAPVTDLHMGLAFFVIPFCFAVMTFRVILYNIKNTGNAEPKNIVTPNKTDARKS